MARIPHALCIHDLSCVGRCSLTVILPALSAMGVQTGVLPTALLSTHTGGFGAPARTDEAAFCRAALAHYEAQNICFDGIYSGYLAHAQHTQLVDEAMRQNPSALKVVDPVMGDGGRLYSALTPALCEAMVRLCAHADVLCPNVTESAVLLGLPPADEPMGPKALQARLAALQRAYPGARLIVVTGARLLDGTHVNAYAGPGAPTLVPYTRVPRKCHGTGDLFAAILTGGLLRGLPADSCIRLAARFIAAAARHTLELDPDARMGVVFEPLLGELASEVKQACGN